MWSSPAPEAEPFAAHEPQTRHGEWHGMTQRVWRWLMKPIGSLGLGLGPREPKAVTLPAVDY